MSHLNSHLITPHENRVMVTPGRIELGREIVIVFTASYNDATVPAGNEVGKVERLVQRVFDALQKSIQSDTISRKITGPFPTTASSTMQRSTTRDILVNNLAFLLTLEITLPVWVSTTDYTDMSKAIFDRVIKSLRTTT